MKILINSSPRSAHAWMQYVLWYITDFDKSVELGDQYSEKMIARTNNPIMLYGKFDDIKQTTIFRDPVTIIPSIMAKAYGGLGNTTIKGVAMPSEVNNVLSLDRMVNHQAQIYRRWADAISENLYHIYAFTFQQATTDIAFVAKSLVNFELSNNKIPDVLESVKHGLRSHDKGHPGFNNPVPVDSKPEIYYESKEALLKSPHLNMLIDLYSSTNDKILKSQEDWGLRG